MRHFIWLIIIGISITAGCSVLKKQSKYNLDFEKINESTGLPMGWGLGNVRNDGVPKDSSLNAYRLESSLKQHGKRALLTEWDTKYDEWTASNYVIHETFTGKKIRLTGYAKTEGVKESAGLWMRIDGDNKVLAFDNMHSRPIKGTTDWKEYTIDLDYDQEEAKQIVVGGLIIGAGKLWIDNFHIAIDDKDITKVPVHKPVGSDSKAALDTTFSRGSDINTIDLNNNKIKELTNLGMLWGFIKYHHDNVSKGEYNMDAELCRVLPKILAAASVDNANAVMEKWVDGFGKPAECTSCSDFSKSETTVHEPDYGYLFLPGNLPATLTDKLKYIRKNRPTDDKHYYIDAARSVGNPVFKNELSYSSTDYPDAGIRLLALYRYWNMIQYFFPDKYLIGEDWNKVLGESIPEFCDAADYTAYQLACLKLIVRVHDTHANIWGGGGALQKVKGEFIPPFTAEFIEGKLVVTFKNDTLKDIPVMVGDIIEKIDGVAVDELVKKYLPLTPGSNYDTQLRDLPGANGFLLRGKMHNVHLDITRNELPIETNVSTVKLSMATKKPAKDAYKMLEGNIGYIFPGKLKKDDLEHIQQLFADTKGLVIDMRCYPSVFMPFTYGKWLKPEASPFVKFTFCAAGKPGVIETGQVLNNGDKNKDNYKGKVVIVVDANTQSQAEYTTMALSTAPRAIVIGSTTAGADGNVSEIVLPGGVKTMISGIGILYPDGTETQRTGVKIDKIIKPTIKGIKEGRDELLEEAINIIKR